MSLPAVTKHLKVLERAGLITRTRLAQWRPCRLEAKRLREVSSWIEQYRRFWDERLDRIEDRIDRDAVLDIGAPAGWGESLDKLDALVVSAEGRTFTHDRLIAAPRERVFAARTDPAALTLWWGPDGFTTTTHAHDLRRGGLWDYTMHGPDGTDYPNVQQFFEIDPPSRIVHLHGSIPDLANDPEAFLVTVTFSKENGGTRITMRGIFKSVEQFEMIKRFGAIEVGQQALARLARHVESD